MRNIIQDCNDCDIVVATDLNGKEIHLNQRIKFGENAYGYVKYSHSNCRFIICWDDLATRNLTQSFASQCEALEEYCSNRNDID